LSAPIGSTCGGAQIAACPRRARLAPRAGAVRDQPGVQGLLDDAGAADQMDLPVPPEAAAACPIAVGCRCGRSPTRRPSRRAGPAVRTGNLAVGRRTLGVFLPLQGAGEGVLGHYRGDRDLGPLTGAGRWFDRAGHRAALQAGGRPGMRLRQCGFGGIPGRCCSVIPASVASRRSRPVSCARSAWFREAPIWSWCLFAEAWISRSMARPCAVRYSA
jgi:hypothetical protein